jgi:MFS family permease
MAWIAARGLSDAGDTMWSVALAWTAVTIAGPAAAGLLVGISTLPRAVFTLAGGVLADRWDTRRIVVLANGARIAVHVLGIVAVTLLPHRTFATLVVVTVLFGVADAVHNPASSTMARQMVAPEALRPLMGTFQTVSRLARLAGAPIGGVLVAAYDVRAAMLVDAASFALIGCVYAVVLHPRFPRQLSAGASWRSDLGAGLRYVGRTPPVRTLLVSFAGLNLFVSPAIAVGIALRVSHEGWGAHTLGVMEACVGAGAAAGALASVRWDPVRPALVAFAILVLQGFGIVAFGFGGQVFLGAAATFVGITAGGASAYLSTLFVLAVDTQYLGRASSVSALFDDAMMPAAMAGFGALSGATSVTTACVAAGLAMSALCTWSGIRMAGVRRPEGAGG